MACRSAVSSMLLPPYGGVVKLFGRDLDSVVSSTECAGPDASAIPRLGVASADQDITEFVGSPTRHRHGPSRCHRGRCHHQPRCPHPTSGAPRRACRRARLTAAPHG